MIAQTARQRSREPLPALGTVRHFAQDQTLYREGEPAGHLMQLVAGMVRSVSLRHDGRRYVEAFHRAGDLFGLEMGAYYVKSAEAVSPCSAVLYPLQNFALQNAGKEALSQQVFTAMQSELQQARDHARLLSRASARERVAAFLIECASRASDWPLVTLAMNRQDIADYLGLSVETLSRTLTLLHRDRLVQFLGTRSLRLIDIPALRDMTG